MNDVVRLANIKAVFKQWEEDGKVLAGWEYEIDGEGQRAKDLRDELSSKFPIGSFEEEVHMVKSTILSYRNK